MSRLRDGVAFGLLAAAAVLATAAPPLDPHGPWRIDEAMREPILDRSQARIDFAGAGRLSGHTSCRAMRAHYTLEGTRLEVGAASLMASRSRCGELQLAQEDRILTALENATSAKVREDGLLELRDADGRGVLRATRFANQR